MLIRKQRLLTPGPTPLYPPALHAMMASDIHHRTKDFERVYAETLADLKTVLGTQNDVVMFCASGTGAMDAAVSNLFSAGDRVLVAHAGKFGERWVSIAKAYGLDVVEVTEEYGTPVPAQRVIDALNADNSIKGVFIQASETSTGVSHDVQAIGEAVKKTDALFIIDAITGIGTQPLDIDNWGLDVVIGGSQKPQALGSTAQGEYTLTYAVSVPARGEATLTLACAVARDEKAARQNLAATLRAKDPIADNRRAWEAFYRKDVPSFACSDPKLTELYDFRWFLLRFSTAGGDLGLFRYPVVLEGRQAFQTYCCYSAPFMAFDRNWMADPKAGWGHIASMVHAAYDDGRFPWYASPRTNDVPLNHASKTGMSLLPWTLWRWYQIHGDRKRIEPLYPGMAKNVRWWIADRDPDSNGLFSIDHQLETGMDDLFRRWKTKNPARYEAVDATVYAYLNLRAVAHLARELGRADDARAFDAYAEKSKQALLTVSWDPKQARFLDRNPDTGEMADYNSICTFYPLMTDVMGAEHLPLVRNYLLNEKEYWTAHPIPALSQTDPDFDPVKGYWRGPSWPAATSHVIEGFATTAKRLDRSLLPEAAELFRRAAANHLQPRADFYERYNPFDGRGLSNFRDYMHSWWIDIYIRHVAGLMLEDDGSLTIDPLPLDLESYALRNVPVRGHKIDVLYNDPQAGPGLTVLRDGKPLARKPDFKPGGAPLKVALPR